MQSELGGILRSRRLTVAITARQLALNTGVSAAYIGRIEKGERFPSARVLCKLAGSLGFDERELLTLAGFRNAHSTAETGVDAVGLSRRRIDPYVAAVLVQERSEVQRTAVAILNLLKRTGKANK